MYHEISFAEQRRRRQRIVWAVALVLLAALLCWRAAALGEQLTREQGAAAVRETVMRCALQCCAVEGSYPTSVKHLEEHYGLVVNAQDYRVSYEWLGDNIPPSVVVRPL